MGHMAWARVTNEKVKETIELTIHISYENKKKTRFPVMIRSNGSRNVDFELFLVIFTQHDHLKGPTNWSHGSG